MKQKGKFTLFDFEEFAAWIAGLHVARTITIIQNHHTWLPDYKAWLKLPEHFHWLESIEDFHIKKNGFSQIAQNLTTFPDGKVAVCRAFDIIPAGIRGANEHGLCIEHIGNFDSGADTMTQEHRDLILKLNAILCKTFAIPICSAPTAAGGIVYHHWYDIVTGHRTNGAGTVKTCPGTAFFGGNTVEACEKEFLPLVTNALKTL